MAGLYIPLDAEYASDDEFLEAGPLAELLYIRALCFCKRKMTDGRVTRSQLQSVAVGIPSPTKHAARLVDVGLWTSSGDGWNVDAYLKRNPSKAEVEASKEIAREAGIRGNHERWHVGDEGKPSPKCPLCVRARIGSPDRVRNRVGSPVPESESTPVPTPTPETEPTPEPTPEPKTESSSSVARSLTAVPTPPRDDDDFKRTVELVVAAKETEYHPRNPRAWRPVTRTNTITEDGELIRALLNDGAAPEQVALFVLGHAEREGNHPEPPTPWCQPDCPDCDGDSWIHTDAGLAPCPHRHAS